MNLQESIRIILREERSGNDRIKSMIKNIGIKRSANIVGGFEKLKSISGIDNYNDFLNLFSDLEKVKSEVDPKFTIYRNKVGNNVIVVEKREFYVDKYVYVNREIIYESIILLIKNGNNKRIVEYFDVLPIVKSWLQNQHGIGVNTRQIDFFHPKSQDFGWYETLT